MTDRELKHALAKLVPEIVTVSSAGNLFYANCDGDYDLFPDEGLHGLCWEAANKFNTKEAEAYVDEMMALDCGIFGAVFATWQTKARLILKVKAAHVRIRDDGFWPRPGRCLRTRLVHGRA